MAQPGPKPATPVSLAVAVSLGVAAILVTIAIAIGGSYVLVLGFIHGQAYQQRIEQLRGSVATCEAVVRMDQASVGASNASSDPNSYGHKLARAIHGLAVGTRCYELVRMVDHHVPYSVILHRLEPHR